MSSLTYSAALRSGPAGHGGGGRVTEGGRVGGGQREGEGGRQGMERKVRIGGVDGRCGWRLVGRCGR